MSLLNVIIDGIKYVPERGIAVLVSIHGMYGCHLFHQIPGATVDEVIANWMAHNEVLQPAIVGGRPVPDLGPSILCSAMVMGADDKELRRVGGMIFPEGETRQPKCPEEVEAWRAALLADPDIPRLLAQRNMP